MYPVYESPSAAPMAVASDTDVDPIERFRIPRAAVPLGEMFGYATDLRSKTQGRGVFTMEFDHYEVVPTHIAQEVINARQKELAASKKEE